MAILYGGLRAYNSSKDFNGDIDPQKITHIEANPHKYLDPIQETLRRQGVSTDILSDLTDREEIYFLDRSKPEHRIFESHYRCIYDRGGDYSSAYQHAVSIGSDDGSRKTVRFVVCTDGYDFLSAMAHLAPDDFFERNKPSQDVMYKFVLFHEIAHTHSSNKNRSRLHNEVHSDYKAARAVEKLYSVSNFLKTVQYIRALSIHDLTLGNNKNDFDLDHQTALPIERMTQGLDTIPQIYLDIAHESALNQMMILYPYKERYTDVIDKRLYMSFFLTKDHNDSDVVSDVSKHIHQRIILFQDAVQYFAPARYERIKTDYKQDHGALLSPKNQNDCQPL